MKQITLFCEGTADSIDKKVVSEIIQLCDLGSKVTIKPLGGKFSANTFIDGFRAAGSTQSQNVLVAFRDRDFGFPANIDLEYARIPKLQHSEKEKTYTGFRITMENYLIDIQLLAAFLKEEPAIISEIVKSAARQIGDYSAVRWAIGDTRKSPGRVDSTWTKGSGVLPMPEVLNSFELCRDKGWEVINKFVSNVNDIYTRKKYENVLEQYQALFSQPKFYDEDQYLVWFQGKDLQKAISLELKKRKLSDISWEGDYQKYFLKNVNFMDKYPDFKEFGNVLERLAKG